jgi:hypothetical protein
MARPTRNQSRGLSLTPNTAKRIARAVVAFERVGGSIDAPARQSAAGDDGLVRGTFTAPWNKGSTKTVTDATLSSVTYEGVKNYFANVTGSGTKACALAYVAGEWILIAAECG